MAQDSFHDFVKELFVGVRPVTIKRMFGGAGGYADGVMFLLLDGDAVHLKADDALKAELRKAGSKPWVWTPKNGPRAGEKVTMDGYWRLPDSALDDPEQAAAWGAKALAVASAAAKAKPKAKAKAKPKR